MLGIHSGKRTYPVKARAFPNLQHGNSEFPDFKHSTAALIAQTAPPSAPELPTSEARICCLILSKAQINFATTGYLLCHWYRSTNLGIPLQASSLMRPCSFTSCPDDIAPFLKSADLCIHKRHILAYWLLKSCGI